MLSPFRAFRAAAAALAVWTLASAGAAYAAPTMHVEGALLSTNGVPAADGDYDVVFAIYASKDAATPAWSEGPVKVKVAGGRFWYGIGAGKELDPKALTPDAWLGVKVGGDPELPRQMMRSVPFAVHADAAKALACTGCVGADHIANGSIAAAKLGFNYAGAATKGGPAVDLECSGCVGVGELKFDSDVDLGGNSIKAKNGSFGGDVVAKTVTATAFVGDGSKLTGVPMPSGACKVGETMTGIAVDGKVVCAPGATGNKVLNGALTTEYSEAAVVSGVGTAIPDNTGADAVANAVFGKVGVANTIAVDIDVANTDLSVVAIKLLPPDDKAKGLTVCDPCGDKDAKSYKVTLTEASTLKVGSLAAYIGKPLDGTWTLKVLDTGFCLPQVPGNETLCNTTNKTDGKIAAFAVAGKVTSSVSVGTPGTFSVGTLDKAPFACIAAKAGHAFFDSVTRRMVYCDGTVWRQVAGLCGNGVVEQGEQCDDGNFDDADGCSAACSAAGAMTTCAAIKAANANAKSGTYTIDVDGAGARTPQQTYCDMTTDGGGWTMFIRHRDPDGHTQIPQQQWDEGITFAAAGGIKQWMVKTYTGADESSAAGSAYHNAWSMAVAAGYQGWGFTFFRYTKTLGYNAHRWEGASRIDSAKILPNSICQGWHGSYSAGRHLWGEHTWSGNASTCWLWMSHCSNPSGHMLIVNHDSDNGAPWGRQQTLILTNKPGGNHGNYDEDGGAFEFFFK